MELYFLNKDVWKPNRGTSNIKEGLQNKDHHVIEHQQLLILLEQSTITQGIYVEFLNEFLTSAVFRFGAMGVYLVFLNI